jgi:uncharacterized protein YciI
MKTRFKALLVVVLAWLVLKIAEWALNTWLTSAVTKSNVSAVAIHIRPVVAYLSGPFAVGLMVGAAVFSVWDWPVVGLWLRKLRERMRNKEEDEQLAKECEELSEQLYEHAAHLERRRAEDHFASSGRRSDEDVEKSWADARAADAREEERIRRQVGPRAQQLIVRLRAKGIQMDLWGFSLSQYDLQASSYFFAEIAQALRDGTYFEKKFEARRSGIPPRL